MNNQIKVYRDGIEEISLVPVTSFKTLEGHVIEHYKTVDGDRYFATIRGTHFCAHGDTVSDAVADALWKDESRRPNMSSLIDEINKDVDHRKITMNEFNLLTGACRTGMLIALKQAGLEKTKPLSFTLKEIKDKISLEWGNTLEKVLTKNT